MSDLCPTPYKVRFTTRGQAVTDGKRATNHRKGSAMKGGQLRPYHCVCGSWHLSHLTKREAKLRARRRAQAATTAGAVS